MNGSSEDHHVARTVEEEDKAGKSIGAVADTVLDLGRDLDQDPRPDRFRLGVHLVLQLGLEA